MIKQVLKTLLREKNLSIFPKTSLNKKLPLLDVGARDGISYPWNTAKSGSLNVILVEPDPQEVELLRKHHQGDILPYSLWSKEDKQIFIDHIRKLHKSIYPFKNGLFLLYFPLQMLATCFKPTHKGWSSVDSSNHLGSRKKSFFWF